jgi:hypothetical protein
MKRKIVLPTLLVVFLILALASTAAAHPAFPAELPLPDGFFPEGIVVGRGTNFYTGSLLDGAIYRGDLRTGEMIAMSDPTGQMAVGLAHDPRTNFVYAASGQGTTGRVAIFDGETMELVDNVTLSEAAGFVNDVTVTGDGAYLTDSFTHVLYRLPLDPETGIPDPAGVTTIPLGGDFQPEAGFNANGIVATANGRWLIVVNSVARAPSTGLIRPAAWPRPSIWARRRWFPATAWFSAATPCTWCRMRPSRCRSSRCGPTSAVAWRAGSSPCPTRRRQPRPISLAATCMWSTPAL